MVKKIDSPEEPENEEGFETIAETVVGESVYAGLKVRIGGKAPMAEMECKITVELGKLKDLPEMVVEAVDQIYLKAQEKGILF